MGFFFGGKGDLGLFGLVLVLFCHAERLHLSFFAIFCMIIAISESCLRTCIFFPQKVFLMVSKIASFLTTLWIVAFDAELLCCNGLDFLIGS